MTSAKGSRVSEKMQRAVRKLQHRIANSNHSTSYQNLVSTDEMQSPAALSRRRSSLSRGRSGSSSSELEESDEVDRPAEESPPYDVPRGFLAVYVGREKKRFVISANYLNHAIFRMLLEKSAEELGFEHKGGLPIACDASFFEHLLWLIESNDPALRNIEINDLCGFCAYNDAI